MLIGKVLDFEKYCKESFFTPNFVEILTIKNFSYVAHDGIRIPYFGFNGFGNGHYFDIYLGKRDFLKSTENKNIFKSNVTYYKTNHQIVQFSTHTNLKEGKYYFEWIDSNGRLFVEITTEKIDKLSLLGIKY